MTIRKKMRKEMVKMPVKMEIKMLREVEVRMLWTRRLVKKVNSIAIRNLMMMEIRLWMLTALEDVAEVGAEEEDLVVEAVASEEEVVVEEVDTVQMAVIVQSDASTVKKRVITLMTVPMKE